MRAKLFLAFKIAVYSALAVVAVIILFTDATIASFIDSVGWLTLLGVMEHETRRHHRPMVSRREIAAVSAASVLAYGIIIYAWWRYFVEGQWLEFVNATAWLGVVIVLIWQIYAPERLGHGMIERAKAPLYTVITGCALFWTFGDHPVIEAVDAWLWLLCFAVIELNVFGFDEARPRGAPVVPGGRTMQDRAA